VDDAFFIHRNPAVVDGFDHPPYEKRSVRARRVDDAVFVHQNPALVDGFDHPPYEKRFVRDP